MTRFSCPKCLTRQHLKEDGETRCPRCGHRVSRRDGVTYTNCFHQDESLSVLEVLSDMGKKRGVPNTQGYEKWRAALESAYDVVSGGGVAAIPEDQALSTYFPARFSQYRALRDLLAGEQAPTHILDVGAGEGMDAFFLSRLYPEAELVALEFSPISAELGSRALPDARWTVGSAAFLPIADESVDFIVA